MGRRKRNLDITGMQFRHLTALHQVGRSNSGDRMWECLCECGKLTTQKIGNLTNGYVKSCGCIGIKYKKEERNLRYFYKHYQATAKKRNLSFHLNYETFLDFTQKNCYYCFCEPMTRTWYNKTFAANGIDRVDSNIGYQVDNCVPSCFICNRAKSDMTQAEFLKWIERIRNYEKK